MKKSHLPRKRLVNESDLQHLGFLKPINRELISTLFADVRHERSLILLLSLTIPDILKQNGFIDHEIKTKNVALQKLPRQNALKRFSFSMSSLIFSV